jgi:predicted transcriptional regulator
MNEEKLDKAIQLLTKIEERQNTLENNITKIEKKLTDLMKKCDAIDLSVTLIKWRV